MAKQTPEMTALLAELRSLTRAVRALTKRLNEQAWNTDAVSVTSLPERFGEDDYDDHARDFIRRLSK